MDVTINTNFFKKNSMEKFFRNHFLSYTLITTFAILLNRPKSPFITFFSVFFISLYSYFVHRIIHIIPNKYNLHLLFHHNFINRTINLIIETVINIGFFVSFYFIKNFLHLNFIDNIIIFYIGVVYITMHIINYSLFNISESHIKHHKSEETLNKKTCNYGPDVFDQIFNTNCDNKFENFEHIISNIIFAYFLTCIVFKKYVF